MRLKTYAAATTAEAMKQIRAELGEDAIIVSSRRAEDGRGINVVVALDEADGPGAARPLAFGPPSPRIRDAVGRALARHGLPSALAETLVETAAAFSTVDATSALAAALEAKFRFDPLPAPKAANKAASKGDGRVLLVGPPGAGKTIVAAKLAARAVLDKRPVGIVTTDGARAGGVEQLAAFTRILNLDLQVAKTPAKLREAVFRLGQHELVAIDTAFVNPFHRPDQDRLRQLIEASAAEPVMVLAAGGDPAEMADTARAFHALGARRMIATRLDAALRLGGILAAADAGPLAFAAIGDTHLVANGLAPASAQSLARRLMKGLGHLTADGDEPLRRAGAAS